MASKTVQSPHKEQLTEESELIMHKLICLKYSTKYADTNRKYTSPGSPDLLPIVGASSQEEAASSENLSTHVAEFLEAIINGVCDDHPPLQGSKLNDELTGKEPPRNDDLANKEVQRNHDLANEDIPMNADFVSHGGAHYTRYRNAMASNKMPSYRCHELTEPSHLHNLEFQPYSKEYFGTLNDMKKGIGCRTTETIGSKAVDHAHADLGPNQTHVPQELDATHAEMGPVDATFAKQEQDATCTFAKQEQDAPSADVGLADATLADMGEFTDATIVGMELANATNKDMRPVDYKVAKQRWNIFKKIKRRFRRQSSNHAAGFTQIVKQDASFAEQEQDAASANFWLADATIADMELAHTTFADMKLANTTIADVERANPSLADMELANATIADMRPIDYKVAKQRWNMFKKMNRRFHRQLSNHAAGLTKIEEEPADIANEIDDIVEEVASTDDPCMIQETASIDEPVSQGVKENNNDQKQKTDKRRSPLKKLKSRIRRLFEPDAACTISTLDDTDILSARSSTYALDKQNDIDGDTLSTLDEAVVILDRIDVATVEALSDDNTDNKKKERSRGKGSKIWKRIKRATTCSCLRSQTSQ
ncbi:uncharacterized protein LOC135487785 [Lineus longissimus]|uniref:uncharacterized protein LOC135487785 n=1 Tax=Lineus longissimus TaxID=88925 RepID=UPI00315D4120